MSSDGAALKRTLKYEKGLTRPKDASAPKRPLTAFFQWANENRERIQKECGSANVAEVSKRLGTLWRELAADDKSGFEDKAKSEMETYKTKFEKHKSTKKYAEHEKNLLEYNIKMTFKPFGKDQNMPKRALSAYMLFGAEQRPKITLANEDLKITEIMSLVAKAWNELSDEEKKPHNDKAKKLSDKHAKEIEKYKQSTQHLKYLEDKKVYVVGIEAKRKRLMKQAGMEVDAGKGSGGTPKSKRAKKSSEPKKKKSASKVSKAKSPKRKSASRPRSAKRARAASKPKAPKTASGGDDQAKKSKSPKRRSRSRSAKRARAASKPKAPKTVSGGDDQAKKSKSPKRRSRSRSAKRARAASKPKASKSRSVSRSTKKAKTAAAKK